MVDFTAVKEAAFFTDLFNIEAIEKASTKELKYHVAEKKAEFIDKDGNLVKPEEPKFFNTICKLHARFYGSNFNGTNCISYNG